MKKVIERSRELIRSEEQKSRHRVREEDFKSGQMFDLSVIIDSDIKEKREITPTGVSFHAIIKSGTGVTLLRKL